MKIFIITGEPSGDLQASLLAKSLRELNQDIEIYAIGGEHLKGAGAQILQDIKELSVLGFFDVLTKILSFGRLMRFILNEIGRIKPDAVIFVDFSGFNLRLAKKINKCTKTIYYISPQVWASRQGRIKTIKEFIDKMIVIFPFEKEFYKKFGIDVEFPGNPLLDIAKPMLTKQEALLKFGLEENKPIFALLPGSRPSEIKHILPIMAQSARFIRKRIPEIQFIISKPANTDTRVYKNILDKNFPDAKIIEGLQYDCLNIADFVLVASGTATLETAIMGKPNVIIYKMGLLNYLLYKPMVKTPFIGMENIVAGKMVAPEYIQFKAKPKEIANFVLRSFLDKEYLDKAKADFYLIKEKLGSPGAPLRAAKAIMEFITNPKVDAGL